MPGDELKQMSHHTVLFFWPFGPLILPEDVSWVGLITETLIIWQTQARK